MSNLYNVPVVVELLGQVALHNHLREDNLFAVDFARFVR
jgi:hypothetical protein